MNVISSWSRVTFALVLAALLSVLAQPVMAQSQNIGGSVVDTTGGLVPDATVKIVYAAKGGVAWQTSTDQSGRFQAINIQPGKYVVTVEKTGFKTAEVAITLDVNAKLDVGQIRLAVGAVTEVLTVEAETNALVTSYTIVKAILVDHTQISELPMNGRNW